MTNEETPKFLKLKGFIVDIKNIRYIATMTKGSVIYLYEGSKDSIQLSQMAVDDTVDQIAKLLP